ncbi:histidine phosphatase family protein [Sphingobacterium sp.]|uniref:histidine phosphatase family protein n=1 Tax=Sphingobacterium sp. TaxID=341027 RepID=UPI002FDE21BC
MFAKKTIITVQHPESIHHLNGMIGSWTDWKLTELGRQQAENMATNLKMEFGDKNFSLYSSPLRRTSEAAEIIGQAFGCRPQFTTALKERNLGRAVGQSVQWLKDNIENQEFTCYDRCFSDAESRYDVWQRLTPLYEKICRDEEEHIILVSHGDTLGIFHVMWLGLDVEMLDKIQLSGRSGGVSILQQSTAGKRVISKLGDMGYQMSSIQRSSF